jgi:microcystin-dependent protein
MAQKDVNTVTTFGNEARIDANFTELYTTTAATNAALDAASANVASALAVLIPAGLIAPYAGSSAPTGWHLCDGSSQLRASFPALFTAIGTTYGSVDGTHFTLPDLTGRVVAGKESSASRLTTAGSGVDGGTLGSAGGTQNVTVSQANLPSATLTTTITDPGHGHAIGNVSGQALVLSNLSGNAGLGAAASTVNFPQLIINSNTTGITASTALGGSGTATKITQPTIILNYIIKT